MPEETKTTEEPKAKKAAGPVACGHENKHYVAPNHKDLQRKRLFCTLPKDHQGDHSSPYQILKGESLVDSVAHWNDDAGKPNAKAR
jgi:hypothetical protein